MARTRAHTRKLKSRRVSYRKRVKNSKCRGLTRTCRKAKGCTMTKSGKRKAYCRKVKNHKVRSLKGGARRRSRRAGSVLKDAAVPVALLALNNYYRPKKGKKLSKKMFKLMGGKKSRKGRKSRKSRKGRKSRRTRKH
jgi:hypothetical protein